MMLLLPLLTTNLLINLMMLFALDASSLHLIGSMASDVMYYDSQVVFFLSFSHCPVTHFVLESTVLSPQMHDCTLIHVERHA